ncbi:MAG: hypothetical protein WDM91_17545 [Rhizomicrobium sp.]
MIEKPIDVAPYIAATITIVVAALNAWFTLREGRLRTTADRRLKLETLELERRFARSALIGSKLLDENLKSLQSIEVLIKAFQEFKDSLSYIHDYVHYPESVDQDRIRSRLSHAIKDVQSAYAELNARSGRDAMLVVQFVHHIKGAIQLAEAEIIEWLTRGERDPDFVLKLNIYKEGIDNAQNVLRDHRSEFQSALIGEMVKDAQGADP